MFKKAQETDTFVYFHNFAGAVLIPTRAVLTRLRLTLHPCSQRCKGAITVSVTVCSVCVCT